MRRGSSLVRYGTQGICEKFLAWIASIHVWTLSMPAIKPQKEAHYRNWGIICAIITAIFLVVAFLPMWASTLPDFAVTRCAIDADGYVIADGTSDGQLIKKGDDYFSHRWGFEDGLVSTCTKNANDDGMLCTPVTEVGRHLGEPVHVDYCGHVVTRVILSDQNFFWMRPLDNIEVVKRKGEGRRLVAALAITYFLLTIFYVFKLYMLRKNSRQQDA